MTLAFDPPTTDKPDPSQYLRKREGSPSCTNVQRKEHGILRSSPKAGLVGAGRPSPGSPPTQRSSQFWRMYDRGDLPVRVEQERHRTIKWTADLSTIDLHYYLPIFFDGLLETKDPFRLLARQGLVELVEAAGPDRLLPVIPQLILALRAALRSPNTDVVMAGLTALRLLAASSPQAVLALMPYYRQLLPPLCSHLSDNLNIGDQMDYGQRSAKGSLGDVVGATLAALERAGGPEAFHHIKYHVPLHESCIRPSRVMRRP